MDYDRRNLATAREILAHPELYGGLDAFPAIWGRMVVDRLGNEAAEFRKELKRRNLAHPDDRFINCETVTIAEFRRQGVALDRERKEVKRG